MLTTYLASTSACAPNAAPRAGGRTACDSPSETGSRQQGVRWKHVADLSHTLSSSFPVIPVPGVTFSFEIEPIATVPKNGVYATSWRLIDHNGTHVDAPNHFVEGGRAMDEVPAEDLIAPLVVIDIRARAKGNPDAVVTPEDILAWERAHGPLPHHAAVVMNSGWADKARHDPKSFVGLDPQGHTHFPGFAVEAISLLVRERDIVGIGVDTLSWDPAGPGAPYPGHKVLLQANKWGLECLDNLDAVPVVGATLIVGALKVSKASASPSRVLAVW